MSVYFLYDKFFSFFISAQKTIKNYVFFFCRYFCILYLIVNLSFRLLMGRKKKTDVYEQFKVLTKKEGMATYECKHCHKAVSSSSSSRLENHLQHCVHYQHYLKNDEEVPTTSGSALQSPVQSLKSLVSVSASPTPSRVLTVSMPNTSDCSTSRPSESDTDVSVPALLSYPSSSTPTLSLTRFVDLISSKQITESREALARWIYVDNLPFSVVESNFFKKFIETLRPAFINHIPSRYEIANPLLNKIYNEMKCKVSSLTESVGEVCLISDGWSNIRGDSVINFVITTPQPIFLKSINATGDSHTGSCNLHLLQTITFYLFYLFRSVYRQ